MQIDHEKEELYVLHGLDRFDQYIYGRKVTIHNDHKLLEAILKKPLAMTPKRLQDIMMRWNRYDSILCMSKEATSQLQMY